MLSVILPADEVQFFFEGVADSEADIELTSCEALEYAPWGALGNSVDGWIELGIPSAIAAATPLPSFFIDCPAECSDGAVPSEETIEAAAVDDGVHLFVPRVEGGTGRLEEGVWERRLFGGGVRGSRGGDMGLMMEEEEERDTASSSTIAYGSGAFTSFFHHGYSVTLTPPTIAVKLPSLVVQSPAAWDVSSYFEVPFEETIEAPAHDDGLHLFVPMVDVNGRLDWVWEERFFGSTRDANVLEISKAADVPTPSTITFSISISPSLSTVESQQPSSTSTTLVVPAPVPSLVDSSATSDVDFKYKVPSEETIEAATVDDGVHLFVPRVSDGTGRLEGVWEERLFARSGEACLWEESEKPVDVPTSPTIALSPSSSASLSTSTSQESLSPPTPTVAQLPSFVVATPTPFDYDSDIDLETACGETIDSAHVDDGTYLFVPRVSGGWIGLWSGGSLGRV